MADKKALYKAAQQAGLDLPDYDDITGPELQALIDGKDAQEQKEDSASVATVVNLRNNPVSVAGEIIKPKGEMKLTKHHMQDDRLMAKIKHGVATGVYSLK